VSARKRKGSEVIIHLGPEGFDRATREADEYAHVTGLTHLVIERFPEGYDETIDHDHIGEALSSSPKVVHRYTVMVESEWEKVADEWDAEVQYEAQPFPEEALRAEYDASHA
jgi:hypothetical protein